MKWIKGKQKRVAGTSSCWCWTCLRCRWYKKALDLKMNFTKKLQFLSQFLESLFKKTFRYLDSIFGRPKICLSRYFSIDAGIRWSGVERNVCNEHSKLGDYRTQFRTTLTQNSFCKKCYFWFEQVGTRSKTGAKTQISSCATQYHSLSLARQVRRAANLTQLHDLDTHTFLLSFFLIVGATKFASGNGRDSLSLSLCCATR